MSLHAEIPVVETPLQEPFCPQNRRRYVLLAAILASALGFIDGSILAIALPQIRANLGASLIEAQWISNAYALTLSALILVGGAAGDTFGLRRVFALGIAGFVAASVLCAIAPDATALIIFRALQGIAAAFMVPGSLAIIAKAYPRTERGRAIGIWAASSSLTTALGPVLGGLLLEWGSESIWRLIFAINLPLGAIALYLLLAKVPADARAEKKHLDLSGAALAVLGLGAISYGLTALGGEKSTSMPSVAIGLGAVLLAAFVVLERRLGENAMIRLRLFAIRQFTGANIATFFLYFALSAVLFYLPMLLIAGWGLTATETSFSLLPLSAAIALLSGPVGRWSDQIGARVPITIGSLFVAAAFAALALVVQLDIRSFWIAILPNMVLMAFGMALVVSPLSAAIMTAVDDADIGSASGINNAVSRIAGLFAVAAMGALAAILYGATDTVPGFGELPLETLDSAIEAVRIAASNRAFAGIAWFSAFLSVASAITAWLTIADNKGLER